LIITSYWYSVKNKRNLGILTVFFGVLTFDAVEWALGMLSNL